MSATKQKRKVSAVGAGLKQKLVVHTVHVEGDDGGLEMRMACRALAEAFECRNKYKHIDKGQVESSERLLRPVAWRFIDGVIWFSGQTTTAIPWSEYYADVSRLLDAASHPSCQAAARHRLQVQEEKFNIYNLNNAEAEEAMDRHRRGGGVFAASTKVDNAVHLVTSMNAFSLLEYIQDTHERRGGDIVRLVGERKEPQTLRRMFEVLDIQDPSALTVEGLGLQSSSEKRVAQLAFLSPDLNKSGKSSAEILRIFLTRSELNNGLFLAEAVRPRLARNGSRSRHVQGTENIVDVSGYDPDAWDSLASWAAQHGLNTHGNNMWVIQVPRENDKKERAKFDFEFHQRQFENFFTPLVHATLAPEEPKHADLVAFLRNVSGFMLAADEESRESDFPAKPRPPNEVPWRESVSELYFAYYFWANLVSLNALRHRLGLNTFQMRSVIGETSSNVDILVYSYLLCDSVTHALMLDSQPSLQFLYGLHAIGVCMSPLSNNTHAVPFIDNPFPRFFKRGLNVSLSTDHPLLYHHSPEPLIEEYGTASKLYRLSGVDMCEIARNSVLISNFPATKKQQWLGERFAEGPKGNMAELSNVPTPRLEMRAASWAVEAAVVRQAASTGHPLADAALAHASHQVQDGNVQFPRILVFGPQDRDAQHTIIAQLLHKALGLRQAYVWDRSTAQGGHVRIENAFGKSDFNESEWMYKTVEGVVVAHEVHQIPRLPERMHRFEDFRAHVSDIKSISDNVHVKAFSRRRLLLLEHRFRLHLAVNHAVEAGATTEKMSHNRDFYQTTKVDTNVRMESGMTARQLLNFIVAKANNNGDDIVNQAKGKEPQTLRQLLRVLNIDPDHLTVDDLNVQVDTALGVASQQFTPEGRDALLTLVLKTDNAMKGRYFAELTKLTFDNFKRDRFTFAENRLPIYGASDGEWDSLSSWFDTHGMACQNNQWIIQIPRIYGHLRRAGKVTNFAQFLENIFQPLWSVSLHPSRNPRLFHFVDHIAAFDCVEDERRADVPLSLTTRAPQEWTTEEDPPYNYYLYHVWANICSLNEFRRRRHFSTFSFRPSCGENGSIDHLIGGFLLGSAINFGIRLKDDSVLQYLFYLGQVGVAVAPLSNNTKVLDYLENPFPSFFRRGLNVSLATDSPLQFHHTQEPLIEEYSIASKVWKLSPNDMCEVARNSVRQSGFDDVFKRDRLGALFHLSSSCSNDALRTHLSDVRVAYRWETYHGEVNFLEHVSGLRYSRAMLTAAEEASAKQAIATRLDVKDAVIGGIIDVAHDHADLQRLSSQRSAMTRQLEELQSTLESLQGQNRRLRDKLTDEVGRDQQAQQLRRLHFPDADVDPAVGDGFTGADFPTYDESDSDTGAAAPYVFPVTPAKAKVGPSEKVAPPAEAPQRSMLGASEYFWTSSRSSADIDQVVKESTDALSAITAALTESSRPKVPAPPPRRRQ